MLFIFTGLRIRRKGRRDLRIGQVRVMFLLSFLMKMSAVQPLVLRTVDLIEMLKNVGKSKSKEMEFHPDFVQ